MIKNYRGLELKLVNRAKELGAGCKKVFLAVSGGVDSSLLAAILCKAFGPDNVVGLYRDIRSKPEHWEDVKLLQSVLGFKLLHINGNALYDEFINQLRMQFQHAGLPWAEEGTADANLLGLTSAYASCKSRFTTPMAGFVSKAIDNGNGRIFGTGNGEEDGFLRYFDKFGDGAVDSNILNGLNKAEVRRMARYESVPDNIVLKVPSADLESNGDQHNDEDQLTSWAKNMGYGITLSYGSSDGSIEGNIAWAWREDINSGVITGDNALSTPKRLAAVPFNYGRQQIELILFLRQVEKNTRHKIDSPPGLPRHILIVEGLVE